MTTYEGIRVYGGDIVSADDVNANIPQIYVKENNTARTSTTSYSDDDELVNLPLEVGVYQIRLSLFYTVASTTPKIKTQWGFTGTWVEPIRMTLGPANDNVSSPSVATSANIAGFLASTQDAVYNSSTTGTYSVVEEWHNAVVVTAAGNLSLRYAQNASNASAVTVRSGTNFYIRKISD